MDPLPIGMLIDGAIQHQVLLNKNPYLTLETMIQRLYKQISEHTRVSFNPFDKTILFSEWHDEILDAYESIKSNLSHEERGNVERVLSKDSPYPAELAKFACCWYKHDPVTVCRWFAVDGIIGFHPKAYVQDAFTTQFAKHNSAVRALYSYYSNPENIKYIVCKALSMEEEVQEISFECDPDFKRSVALYKEMVSIDEIERVVENRQAKLQAQQQPAKRKKKNRPVSPRPVSPQCISSPS